MKGTAVQLIFLKTHFHQSVVVTAIGFWTESEPSINHDESTNMATFNDGPIRKN